MKGRSPAHEADGGEGESYEETSAVRTATRSRNRSTSFSFTEQKSPLELHLPYLNLGLCLILILMGVLARSEGSNRVGTIGLGNLPAMVYAVVLAAKMVMASVDPEKELGALKYEYKGA
jgi:hypothetical protein